MATENTKEKIYDPSLNVRDMINEAIDRGDDIHNSGLKRIDDILSLKTYYEEKLKEVEAKRLDDKFRDTDTKYQIQFSAAKEALGIA